MINSVKFVHSYDDLYLDDTFWGHRVCLYVSVSAYCHCLLST